MACFIGYSGIVTHALVAVSVISLMEEESVSLQEFSFFLVSYIMQFTERYVVFLSDNDKVTSMHV